MCSDSRLVEVQCHRSALTVALNHADQHGPGGENSSIICVLCASQVLK